MLDERELVESPRREKLPGLPVITRAEKPALLELGQEPRERLERAAAEDVRPARPRPVVHRHEATESTRSQVNWVTGSPIPLKSRRFGGMLLVAGGESDWRLSHISPNPPKLDAMADWAAHVERQIERYRDGEGALPDAATRTPGSGS